MQKLYILLIYHMDCYLPPRAFNNNNNK